MLRGFVAPLGSPGCLSGAALFALCGEAAGGSLLFADGGVVLAALLRREAHVTARLTRDLVSVTTQELGELAPGQVARQAHSYAAITSSRTR